MEILAGGGIEKAFEHFGIEATRTYHWDNPNAPVPIDYEIWEITAPDLKMIGEIPDEEWQDDWGWFRYSEGTVLENNGTTREATINGFLLDVFTNDNWERAVHESIEDDEIATKIIKDREHSVYPNLLAYLLQEFNVSMETNIAAITCGLAKINKMTMAELWRRCQGEERIGKSELGKGKKENG